MPPPTTSVEFAAVLLCSGQISWPRRHRESELHQRYPSSTLHPINSENEIRLGRVEGGGFAPVLTSKAVHQHRPAFTAGGKRLKEMATPVTEARKKNDEKERIDKSQVHVYSARYSNSRSTRSSI